MGTQFLAGVTGRLRQFAARACVTPPWRSLSARMASRRRRQSGRAFYRKMLVVVVLSCQHATKRKFKKQLEAEPPASKTDTGAPATSMTVRAWPHKVEIPSSTPASHGQV